MFCVSSLVHAALMRSTTWLDLALGYCFLSCELFTVGAYVLPLMISEEFLVGALRKTR